MRSLVASLVLALTPLLASAQQPRPASPTVGLALSGGSAKGIAHIGVLRTLERLGVRVDVVAGTSMGAVVGGLYALGLSVDSIESVIAGAEWSALIGDGTARGRLFLDQRRLDERTVLSVPLEDRRITLPAGAIVGSNVMRVLEHVTWRAATVRRFTDLPRPFVAVATDLETGEAVTLREGVLSEALRASAGVPGAIEPLLLDGRLLVDGALSRNLPASDARDLGADFVICSDVSEPLVSAEELRSMVGVLTQLASLSMLVATRAQRELCDVLIEPDVDEISGFDFERVEEWVERGVEAASSHTAELRRVAGLQPDEPGTPPVSPDDLPSLLGDSVRITRVTIAGTEDPRVADLVRSELEVEPGTYVGSLQMESRLAGLGATGLFGLVRYRLDDDGPGQAALTVVVQERARDRLGVGLRYDDERQAALLFTARVHNLLLYGSSTRVEVRVGEETAVGISFHHRRGVTGRSGVGGGARWSQASLDLSSTGGGRVGVEIARATASLGLGAGRATYLGLAAGGERTFASVDSVGVWLLSGSAILDHETLDRVDFPQSGQDVSGRLEWGGTDVTERGWFSIWTIEARSYVPFHRRLSLDLGAFFGYARGPDLPVHRRFFLGGAHRSSVFRATHPSFHGLESQEQSGRAVQVARAGLRWEARPDLFVRAGVDVGGVRDEWAFPMDRPMTGWAL
ncbi:MAG TPA: patatin-like phospholipase family protein, partial [Longimicrobiales bacterium]|nr:patatin-like phospholipase family protein [Longimicrobiales bacterium]